MVRFEDEIRKPLTEEELEIASVTDPIIEGILKEQQFEDKIISSQL